MGKAEVEAGEIGVGVELPVEELLIAVRGASNEGERSGVGAIALDGP